MDLEDLEPKNTKHKLMNLEIMSIEALYDYIKELQDEIKRVEEEITSKKKAKVGAESVFKK